VEGRGDGNVVCWAKICAAELFEGPFRDAREAARDEQVTTVDSQGRGLPQYLGVKGSILGRAIDGNKFARFPIHICLHQFSLRRRI